MVSSTQQAIEIAGIKDGIIVMKDGSYRLVFQVAATNFALKSEQEQNSIIFQYQSFLNSLHFPIQIVISSRRLDLTPYINKIEKTIETQTSDLMKAQTADYIDFLKKLIDLANIMKKTFYVVVPYNPLGVQKIGFFGSLFGKKPLFEHLKISEEDFRTHTQKLREEANTVAQGLGSMGLHCFQLNTEQLIELFYLSYNPDEATKEVVKDATQLASPVVMSEQEFVNAGIENPAQATNGEQIIDNTVAVQEQQKHDAIEKRQTEAATQNSAPQPAQPAAQSAPQANQPAPQPGVTPQPPQQPPIQNQSS